MIVEFIGCSGAGKTTLLRAVTEKSSPGTPVIDAWDLVLDRPGRRWITAPKGVNAAADITSVVPFLRARKHNEEFVRFALRRLLHGAPSAFARLNYARNLVRRVGLHEHARRRGDGAHVLFDEGTVLIAYQVLVYSRAPVTDSEIRRFAELVPPPDLLVHVRAPSSVLVERAVSRSDPRRELKGRDARQLSRALERADDVFVALASTAALKDRVLVVDNPNSSGSELSSRAQQIVTELQAVDEMDTHDVE